MPSHGPNLDYLLHAIEPAVARTAKTPEEARLAAAIKANVDLVVGRHAAFERNPAHARARPQTADGGAYYEPASGRVLFSGTPHEVTDAQRARGRLASRTASARKH